MRKLVPVLLVAAAFISSTPAFADDDTTPGFDQGFAELHAHLGSIMGQPVTSEYADPSGSGDTLQQTTTGLARYHLGAMPAFFDGYTRYTWTPDDGEVEWHSNSWTPPAADLSIASTGWSLQVRVTYYLLSGRMANGHLVHAGAAACSSNIPMGSTITFRDGMRVVCEDTGLLGNKGWIDVWGRPDVVSRYGDYTTVTIN